MKSIQQKFFTSPTTQNRRMILSDIFSIVCSDPKSAYDSFKNGDLRSLINEAQQSIRELEDNKSKLSAEEYTESFKNIFTMLKNSLCNLVSNYQEDDVTIVDKVL